MEQLAGAGVVSIVVLAYVLLLEAVTAAIVMLGQFLVLQVRSLRSLVMMAQNPPTSAPLGTVTDPAPSDSQGQPYQLGGDLKWQ